MPTYSADANGNIKEITDVCRDLTYHIEIRTIDSMNDKVMQKEIAQALNSIVPNINFMKIKVEDSLTF